MFEAIELGNPRMGVASSASVTSRKHADVFKVQPLQRKVSHALSTIQEDSKSFLESLRCCALLAKHLPSGWPELWYDDVYAQL